MLDTMIFSKGIEKVEYAITEKSFSPVLTGVLMKSKTEDAQHKIIFVGTDSFRLSEYKVTSSLSQDFSLIIPKVSISDIKYLVNFAIDKEVPEMTVKYSDNLIAFELTL